MKREQQEAARRVLEAPTSDCLELRIKVCVALESGKYEQCADWLRVGDAYSIEGVICEALRREVCGTWLGPDVPGRPWLFAVPGVARAEQMPQVVLTRLNIPDFVSCKIERMNDDGWGHKRAATFLRSVWGLPKRPKSEKTNIWKRIVFGLDTEGKTWGELWRREWSGDYKR